MDQGSSRPNAAVPKKIDCAMPWEEELVTGRIIDFEECGHSMSFTQLWDLLSLLNWLIARKYCGHSSVGRFPTRHSNLRSKTGGGL